MARSRAGSAPLMTSTSSLVSPQRGSADPSRAARLRVPAGGEKQGRQADRGRHATHDDVARRAGGEERVRCQVPALTRIRVGAGIGSKGAARPAGRVRVRRVDPSASCAGRIASLPVADSWVPSQVWFAAVRWAVSVRSSSIVSWRWTVHGCSAGSLTQRARAVRRMVMPVEAASSAAVSGTPR